MKNLLVICCLCLGCSAFGQHIKKKLYGSYEGTIPAYRIDVGQIVAEVSATTVRIELRADGTIVQQLDNTKQTGTWQVDDTEKAFYAITYRLDGQLAEERLILYKKARTMTREGIFPQPDAELRKE